ncbi:hypothetical protein CLF_107392, partial [Clonorchis sinensis]
SVVEEYSELFIGDENPFGFYLWIEHEIPLTSERFRPYGPRQLHLRDELRKQSSTGSRMVQHPDWPVAHVRNQGGDRCIQSRGYIADRSIHLVTIDFILSAVFSPRTAIYPLSVIATASQRSIVQKNPSLSAHNLVCTTYRHNDTMCRWMYGSSPSYFVRKMMPCKNELNTVRAKLMSSTMLNPQPSTHLHVYIAIYHLPVTFNHKKGCAFVRTFATVVKLIRDILRLGPVGKTPLRIRDTQLNRIRNNKHSLTDTELLVPTDAVPPNVWSNELSFLAKYRILTTNWENDSPSDR